MGLTWNLAVFGVLALWAAGTTATQAVLSLKGEGRPTAPWSAAATAVMVVVGGLVALLGMQHPERMVNLLANPGAAITQQIYTLVALFVVSVACLVACRRNGEGEVPSWVAVVALVVSVAVAVCVGRRFLMPSAPLLNSWLWVAAGMGFSAASGAGTVCALRCALGSVSRGLAAANVAAGGVHAACVIAYLVFLGQVGTVASTSGITFDPTHPSAAGASASLGAGQVGLAWGVCAGVGAAGALAFAVAAWLVARRFEKRTGLVVLCCTAGTLCAVCGALVLRVVAFGLL